ncbi:MAG: N-acetylmuramoyl-L-alanine amidase [Candidatus Zixiibacteriota bacterium]
MPKLYWKPARGFAARPAEFKVDWIVLHYTAGSYPGDLNWLARSPRPSCPSAHFYICPRGDVYQMVRLENVAFHAGITWSRPYTWQWRRWRALRPNERSVGIEISNAGPPYDFTEEQYRALAFLLPPLLGRFGVPVATLPDPWRGCDPTASNSHGGDAYDIGDFDGFRGLLAHGNVHYSKTDPGLLFDWDRVRALEPFVTPPSFAANVVWRGDPAAVPAEGVSYL